MTAHLLRSHGCKPSLAAIWLIAAKPRFNWPNRRYSSAELNCNEYPPAEKSCRPAKDAKEIILATSTTIDGETTAMYLGRLLKETYPNLLITRIAHGLPSGGLLDYADEMTLSHALSDRREMR